MDRRGLIQGETNALRDYFANGSVVVYCGFDATAPSLTIGNLLLLVTMRRLLESSGIKVIGLIGESTALIGDPSFRSTDREAIEKTQILHNVHGFELQMRQVIGQSDRFEICGNTKSFDGLGYVEFMDQVGRHVSVNEMLRRTAVQDRLETGLSFAELGYMVMQAFDFERLFVEQECRLQIGGSDQWGNICSGIDLIKKRHNGAQAFGLTVPLVTDSQGRKIGKSSGKAIWLDREMTSPWDFFQYWRSISDELAMRLIKMFSLQSWDAVADLISEHEANPGKSVLQRELAREMTELVHGPIDAEKCVFAAEALFGADSLNAESTQGLIDVIPTSRTKVDGELDIVSVLVSSGLASSKRQAREFLQSGAIETTRVELGQGIALVIRKGKKGYHLLLCEE